MPKSEPKSRRASNKKSIGLLDSERDFLVFYQPPGCASRRCQPFICLSVILFVFLADPRPPCCASHPSQYFTDVLYLTVASSDPSKFPGFDNHFDSLNFEFLIGFLAEVVALSNHLSSYCSD